MAITHANFLTQVRNYTEVDSNVLSDAIIQDFIRSVELDIAGKVDYDDLRKISEIEKCIYLENAKREKRSKSELSKSTSFYMLSGPSGGYSCVEYFEKLFSKDVLKSKSKFGIQQGKKNIRLYQKHTIKVLLVLS